ncbi:uncharacterized protein LOC132743631 [Ruditapes philippinarum]|uniref:uncharacterized protein LOC132743631 n=1 Tax=Ruditapes philippinarum TaxID=129788 RepID=UPI00295C1932|nr:uncharacterized protein LOC132743631 [Ruditapes philippinarum]
MFIDTMSVPEFQQKCECVVTPLERHNTFKLHLKLEHLSGRYKMQFEINNISIGKFYDSESTYVTGATKLLFSTTEDHRTEGLCLAVYSDGAFFNMSCKRSTRGTTRQSSPASTTGTTRQSSPSSTTGTTRQPSPAPTRGTTRQFSSASISHESETTKITTLKYYNSSVQASKDKATGVNAFIIPTVSAACGLLCGIVIAVVCVIVYKRKKRGKGRHVTMIIPTDANVESDYYMTENAMYNMGKICTRQPTNENEHHNVDHDAGAYAGVSPGHYDCIQESTDRNQTSDIAPSHAVSNEYSTCLKAGQVTAGGLNNNTSNNYQKYQPKVSRINGEDGTVYDSTKSSLPQQAVGNNDYHHLDSVGFNQVNLTYDKIGNTGVVKY